MNTTYSAPRPLATLTTLVDGLLTLCVGAGAAYSVVVIAIGFLSQEDMAGVAVILGAFGLLVFLPGLVLLVAGWIQRSRRRPAEGFLFAGRIAAGLAVALAVQWVLALP